MKEDNYEVEQDLNGDTVIKIPKRFLTEKKETEMVYLSDFMTRLPSNCIFLKGVTGCGATTLALQDNSNCIIALPTRNTVHSKWVIRDHNNGNNIIGYDTDIFCIYGGFHDTKEELIAYINQMASKGLPVKLVCTYDQVEKLAMRMTGKVQNSEGKWVQDESNTALCINIRKYRLYVDEIHQVLDYYKTPDRRKNIRGLLSSIKMFDDVTCITATPLERKYFFDEIKGLPVVRVDYEGFFRLNPHYEEMKRKIQLQKCAKLPTACVNIVKDYLQDKAFGNAHIFVNSVDFIAKVIKAISEDKTIDESVILQNVRVVCGDTEINAKKIKKAIAKLSPIKAYLKASNDYNEAKVIDDAVLTEMRNFKDIGGIIDSINSPTRKVNFYTASAWLGADVFDATGQIYIISDGARKYTMADISTAYIQILGRIRDSVNRKVIHLYSENRYITDIDDAESQFLQDEKARKNLREELMGISEQSVKMLYDAMGTEKFESTTYLTREEDSDNFVFDKYLQWNDEISFKVVKGQYASEGNMTIEMIKNGWNVESLSEHKTEAEKLKRNRNARTNFKDIFNEYVNLRSGVGMGTLFADIPAMINMLETAEPCLRDAYEILGIDMVKALGYKRREIIRAISMEQNKRKSSNINRLLSARIKPGGTYTNDEIKRVLTFIQEKLHLGHKLKITDFYEVEESIKKIEGKTTRGKKIIRFLPQA